MIRPAYWTDADLHTRLTADCREFYVGCWMEADDAGYIAWDPDRLGADLYPFRSLSWRRAHLAKWLVDLSVAGHLRMLDCGKHVVVPNLPRYQHAPKPGYQNQRAHDTCLRKKAPSGTTGDPVEPAGKHDLVVPLGASWDHVSPAQGVGIGVGVGIGFSGAAAPTENNGTTGLKERIGDFAAIVGGKAS